MDTNVNDQQGQKVDPQPVSNPEIIPDDLYLRDSSENPAPGENPDLPALTNIDVDELADDFSEHEAVEKARAKWFRGMMILSAVGLVAIICAVIVTVFKLDSAIFPVTVTGAISDYANRPLTGVNVCMQEKCVLTNSDGIYTINNLKYGKYVLTADQKGFKQLYEEVDLQRGTNQIDRSLKPLGFGDLNGSLTLPAGTTLIGKDFIFLFNNNAVTLDSSNHFQVKGITVGTYKLEIKSPSYTDVNADVEVKEGNVTLPPIVLQPAMDVLVKVNDWISGSALIGTLLEAGTSSAQTDKDGNALLKDLPVSDTYSFRVSKDGYNVKAVSARNLVQGLNNLEPFTLVKTGRIYYLSTRLGNSNLYMANYDGSDEKLLTDNKGDVFDPVLLSDDKIVAFLSTRDQLKDGYGQVIKAPYTVDIASGKINSLVTGNYGNDGLGNFNLQAQKRAFSRYVSQGYSYLQQLYFGDINGNSPVKLLEKTNGNFGSILIANNSSFLVYDWSGYGIAQNEVYYLNPLTHENRKIYSTDNTNYCDIVDISSDLKNVLIRVTNNSNYSSDLYNVNVSGNKTIRVTNTSTYESAARYSADGNSVYFMSTRDNKTDVYSIKVNGTSEQKLTGDGKVSGFRIEPDGLILFTSEQDLYVTDTSVAGLVANKVTGNVTNNSFAMTNMAGDETNSQY